MRTARPLIFAVVITLLCMNASGSNNSVAQIESTRSDAAQFLSHYDCIMTTTDANCLRPDKALRLETKEKIFGLAYSEKREIGRVFVANRGPSGSYLIGATSGEVVIPVVKTGNGWIEEFRKISESSFFLSVGEGSPAQPLHTDYTFAERNRQWRLVLVSRRSLESCSEEIGPGSEYHVNLDEHNIRIIRRLNCKLAKSEVKRIPKTDHLLRDFQPQMIDVILERFEK